MLWIFLLASAASVTAYTTTIRMNALGTPSALENGWLSVADAGEKGLGLFSCRNLPSGTIIGEYIGELLTYREILKRYPKGNSEYVFQVTDDDTQRRELLYIDARDPEQSNLTRYINCDRMNPNLVVNVEKREQQRGGDTNLLSGKVTVKASTKKKNLSRYCVVFSTLRDIAAGEELTFDYGEKYPI